ncbi:hypothetical protein [Treponema phagedenis]|uniref:hypothetical protein n=1 Tax=Treponema phagedenis TaxID=162 RepID=UPI0011E6DA5D|nr:hypothetical protein [Treponema phagedenis]QEK04826.1 hypothetical protein FUT83_14170 [Treponema phagedenis]QEK10447.1 hypothetical protein FUT81_14090 [Treponema phagedenis]
MQKKVKWFIAAFVAASLFLSCPHPTNDAGGGKSKFIPENITSIDTQKDEQAKKIIEKLLANGGKHSADVFVVMGGEKAPDGTTVKDYEQRGPYETTLTVKDNGDGTYFLASSEMIFGLMPLSVVSIFPKVRIVKTARGTYSLESVEKGFSGFYPLLSEGVPILPSLITDEVDRMDIEKVKSQATYWGQSSTVRPDASELVLDGEKLKIKAILDWNLKLDTVTTQVSAYVVEALLEAIKEARKQRENGEDKSEWEWVIVYDNKTDDEIIALATEEQKGMLPGMAYMFENVKSAFGTKGDYIFDPDDDSYKKSGEVVLKKADSRSRSVVSALVGSAIDNEQPLSIEALYSMPAQPVIDTVFTREELIQQMLGTWDIPSSALSKGKPVVLKDHDNVLPDNTIRWTVAESGELLDFTSKLV